MQNLTASPASTATRSAVVVRGLRKSFGPQVVLDGIDLDVAEATVFALLGPNGSGKTTTIRILSTLLAADGGTARVAGHDPATEPDLVRAAIGVTGQFSAVDELLTGQENLILMADLHHLGRAEGRRRAAGLLERFELTEAAGKVVSTYSGGMRRRLDLAMTLVGDPRIIFLDEPTTGLDPRSRRTMWEIIRQLVAGGVTIFLTTQYLEEADELAGRIGVLDHGRMVAEGTAAELKRQIPGGRIDLQFGDAAALDSAARLLGAGSRDEAGLVLQVPYDGRAWSLKGLLDRLETLAIPEPAVSVHTPDLDDVFFALTGHPPTDQPRTEQPGSQQPSTEQDAPR
jgi:ABC-2 type transport system ATP-binding protein